MRILIVSTLKRKVTPDNFASRSRIIYQVAEGLAKRGHTVSLLGTGDSEIPGVKIIPAIERGWVDLPPVENEFLRQTANLIQLNDQILSLQKDYDIIHNHTYPDFFPLAIEDKLTTPLLTTFHAVYDYYLDELLATYTKTHFVALSKRYTTLFKKARIPHVVYNGVNTNFYTFNDKKEDYLFWLGRLPKGKNNDGTFLDPKGVKWAIQLAQQTDSRLFLSAPVEDKKFFEQEVAPHLTEKIQWVGDVSAEQTVPVEKIVKLFQHARAFLMTVNQPENFGLVMAEAGSCGTPVIAFDRGAVSEIVVDGKTGFVVSLESGVDGLKTALSKIDTIKPQDCRDHITANFSTEKMVENYEDLYKQLAQ